MKIAIDKRLFFFLVGVSSMKQLEDEVHKTENLGLDKTTVEVLINRISKHTYQNVSAKSLRRTRLFDCSILELPHTQAEKILTCLVPREKLDEKIVRTFVTWVLTNNRRLNLEHSLRPAIRWINCVIRHSLCSISSLQFAYEPFFQLLGIGTVVRNFYTTLDSRIEINVALGRFIRNVKRRLLNKPTPLKLE